jgi:hypothetical protein
VVSGSQRYLLLVDPTVMLNPARHLHPLLISAVHLPTPLLLGQSPTRYSLQSLPIAQEFLELDYVGLVDLVV